jgi:hypothetical protein
MDAALVAKELEIKLSNTYPLLSKPEEQGILKARAEHRSVKLWRSDEILNAIDRFAERAGRCN